MANIMQRSNAWETANKAMMPFRVLVDSIPGKTLSRFFDDDFG